MDKDLCNDLVQFLLDIQDDQLGCENGDAYYIRKTEEFLAKLQKLID